MYRALLVGPRQHIREFISWETQKISKPLEKNKPSNLPNVCNNEPINQNYLRQHGAAADLRRGPLSENACSNVNDDQEELRWTNERLQEAVEAANRNPGQCQSSDKNSRDQAGLENDISQQKEEEAAQLKKQQAKSL